MLLLVSGATDTVRRYARTTSRLGVLYEPVGGNSFVPGLQWAADNGAFGGFKEAKYKAMLDRLENRPGCLFVVVPDVVASHGDTMALWDEWAPKLAHRFPLAFVLQDGLRKAWQVPREARAVFVGGSTEFKESAATHDIADECRARGQWVHVGRVNTKRRIKWAAARGYDSIDGSGFSKWPDTRIQMALRWIEQATAPRLL